MGTAARRRHVPCGARLLDLASMACRVGDHRWVIFSVAYLLARCLLGCLMVLGRREASKDAELLVLREDAVRRRLVQQEPCQRRLNFDPLAAMPRRGQYSHAADKPWFALRRCPALTTSCTVTGPPEKTEDLRPRLRSCSPRDSRHRTPSPSFVPPMGCQKSAWPVSCSNGPGSAVGHHDHRCLSVCSISSSSGSAAGWSCSPGISLQGRRALGAAA